MSNQTASLTNAPTGQPESNQTSNQTASQPNAPAQLPVSNANVHQIASPKNAQIQSRSKMKCGAENIFSI
jgi:hypothetical protein